MKMIKHDGTRRDGTGIAPTAARKPASLRVVTKVLNQSIAVLKAK